MSGAKGNNSSLWGRLTKRIMTLQCNLYNVTALFAVVTFLVLYMYKDSVLLGQLGVEITTDRSEIYNVKILPANLDDEALASLEKSSFSYLAMIDAGSSGCRAHVYRYGKLGSQDGPLYVLPQHDSKKVKPGLSSFASNPTDAGASLAGLIDFVKAQVPEAAWKDTPIWLKATAGLRMLEQSKSDHILHSVRAFLKSPDRSPFLFRDSFARIISGNEEGGFGWIAFNYLKKIIGPRRDPVNALTPYAVVEMGGASSQVSQVAPTLRDADKIPLENRFSFSIGKDTFHLYTHSYLGYGAEQGRETFNKALAQSASSAKEVMDPCLNNGYTRDGAKSKRSQVYEGIDLSVNVKGASTATGSCCTALAQLFNNAKADNAVCKTAKAPAPYSFNCVHQPNFVAQSANFLVFENFFYVSSGIGLGTAPRTTQKATSISTSIAIRNVNATSSTIAGDGAGFAKQSRSVVSSSSSSSPASPYPQLTTPGALETAAAKVCGASWDQLQQQYPADSQSKDNNIKWCFAASYASSFLINGLGLTKDKVVTIQREVGSSEIEWALGAAYKEAADLIKRTNLRPQ